MPQRSTASVDSDFFRMLPARSAVLFLLAVFFTFAPLSLLLASSFAEERNLGAVLLYMAASGAVAVSWAGAFTYSRWFAVGIVGFTALLIALSSGLIDSKLGLGAASLSIEGVASAAAVVVGYVLFVTFISGQGRNTVRLVTEMSLAREIHETLVPTLRQTSGAFEILGASVACTEVGGDLVDVVQHDTTTDLYLADVSGHGVKAGVVMAMVKASIRTRALRDGDFADLVRDVNTVIEHTTSAELYATLAGLRMHHDSRRVEFTLAGHHPIVHYRKATHDIVELGQRGFPVGMMPDKTFEVGETRVESGDLLAVYTDGLNETTDAADAELGHEAVRQQILDNAAAPLEELRRRIFDLATRHGEQNDDRTLLLVRIT